jgi:pyruvate dehydrogenase E1 component alpha subunit
MTDRCNIDVERLSAHYRTMARIRAFEEAAEQASKDGLVTGAVHLSIGQEAVAAGVCANLTVDDQITTTHRGHGHCIAKGTDPGRMMLELFGREGGTCGGKGGSMHIADFTVGMLGANGVVAAGIPIAVGAAHGARLMGKDRVVVCFFGDGAVNRGPFLEGLNWATIFRLPVLFVCESNGFASTTRTEAMTGGPGPVARAEALGVPAAEIDGNDVLTVDDAAAGALARIRAGGGPELLLARTYRLKGHTASDAAPYRQAKEVEARWADDPLAQAAAMLRQAGVDTGPLDGAAKAEIAAAVEAARAAPFPAAATAFADIQDVGAPAWAN